MTDTTGVDTDGAAIAARVGFYAAVLTAALTVVAFALALAAIPISGANCPGECIRYPYLDTVAQFPGDYRWMLPAAGLVLIYVVLMAAIHSCAAGSRRVFSLTGLSFAIMAAVLLAGDYFVQFSVVPVSLMNGETQGVALLTQYNPHGLFIALEELGYLLLSLSFVCTAPVFSGGGRLETAVRWVFVAGGVLAFAALGVIAARYGLERKDRFEVVVLSLDWLVLIVNGVLLSLVFWRRRSHKGCMIEVNTTT